MVKIAACVAFALICVFSIALTCSNAMTPIDVDLTTCSSLPTELSWLVGLTPAQETYDNNGLTVQPKSGTDFWRNTYYEPVLQAYNGHVLGIETTDDMVVVETKFSFNAQMKFDQAGVFIGSKETDWVKAGVEYVDGEAWQSVVVTRDDYSDWSKARLPWPNETDVYIRLYRQGDSGIVEVSEDGIKYEFVRIFHLPMAGPVSVGAMVCRPSSESSEPPEPCVTFKYIKINNHDGYHHNADE